MTQQGGRENGQERDGGWAGPGSREGVSHRPQARITKQSRAPVGMWLGLRGGNRVQILVLPLTSSGAPGGSPHIRVRGFPPLKTGLSTFSLAGGTGVRPVGGWRARAQRRLNLRWPFSGFSPCSWHVSASLRSCGLSLRQRFCPPERCSNSMNESVPRYRILHIARDRLELNQGKRPSSKPQAAFQPV